MALTKKSLKTEIVGLKEVAELLGVRPPTISSYLSRGQMIEPLAQLACGPVWLRSDIVAWDGRRPSRAAA
jgi:predicted DNA-binding transcriptional regulator AlpA